MMDGELLSVFLKFIGKNVDLKRKIYLFNSRGIMIQKYSEIFKEVSKIFIFCIFNNLATNEKLDVSMISIDKLMKFANLSKSDQLCPFLHFDNKYQRQDKVVQLNVLLSQTKYNESFHPK